VRNKEKGVLSEADSLIRVSWMKKSTTSLVPMTCVQRIFFPAEQLTHATPYPLGLHSMPSKTHMMQGDAG
jgi:hypothetical protein